MRLKRKREGSGSVGREETVREIADQAVSREGILSLLNVFVNNPGLSAWNLLMVYSQNLSARYVCGRKAWEAAGRYVKEGAEGITLLFPKFTWGNGRLEASFQEVTAYGLEDTEGVDFRMPQGKVPFADRITRKTGAAWELTDRDRLQDGHGYYDAGMDVFYLPKGCGEEQASKMALGMYIDYCLLKEGEAEPLLKFAVSYVLFEHFHFRHTVVGALFGRLAKYPLEEKISFLRRVRRIAVGIMGDMEGEALGFDEVAFLNEFLVSPEKDRICGILEGADLAQCEGELAGELITLREKLKSAGEGCIRGLYERRMSRCLFSCPPVRLDGLRGSGKE